MSNPVAPKDSGLPVAFQVWAKEANRATQCLIVTIPYSFRVAIAQAEYLLSEGATEVLIKEVKWYDSDTRETPQIDVRVGCNLAVRGWACRLAKYHKGPCERYDGKTADQILLATPVEHMDRMCPMFPAGSDGHTERCCLPVGHEGGCRWASPELEGTS